MKEVLHAYHLTCFIIYNHDLCKTFIFMIVHYFWEVFGGTHNFSFHPSSLSLGKPTQQNIDQDMDFRIYNNKFHGCLQLYRI